MTRKHFQAIADALRDSKPEPETDDPNVTIIYGAAYFQWRLTISNVARACAQFNPAFDRDRFLTAYGVDQ